MNNIRDLMTLIPGIASLPQQKPEVPIIPESVQLVDYIFSTMSLVCRGFNGFYADKRLLNAEKKIWNKVFSSEGFTEMEQIAPAMQKLYAYKHPNPPQLGEFLSWLPSKQEQSGLPPVEEAYKISLLINRQFSDYVPTCDKTYTVIKHAINQINPMTYREMPEAQSKKTFQYYYQLACEQFLEGKLQLITKALPERVVGRSSNANARDEAIKSIKDILGMQKKSPITE